MLGYTRDEFIGLHASDIVTPTEVQHIGLALNEIKAKADHHREWQFRRKDGSIFPAEVIATMMPDGNLLAMIRDITERKRTEEARWVSEARYRALFEYAPIGILIGNPENVYLDANVSMCRMLGYAHDELVGFASDPMSHRRKFSTLKPLWARSRPKKLDHNREWRFRRKDGSILETEAMATLMPDGNFMAMIRDIADRNAYAGRVAATRCFRLAV